MRRARPSLVSFALGFAGATVFAGNFGLFSIGIEVALTLLLISVPLAALPLGLALEFELSAASLPFSSASVCALVSAASSFKAAAFLSRGFASSSSSAPWATWKLIWVPKRGLSVR